MTLAPILFALALQVGPNPNSGDIRDTPEDLLNRPPRPLIQDNDVNPSSAWLQECLSQVDNDPARAHSFAQIRRNETSGTDRILANHCLGLAATDLGLWSDAQSAFVAAREETPAEQSSMRARFGTMAGNAALASGDANAALVLLTIAQNDARSASSATLEAIAAADAARALVALGQTTEAMNALDMATTLEPRLSEPWLLKATLLRRMERLDEAQQAIESAAAIRPLDGAIGLEAGLIAVLQGREESARASWQSVLDTQPESPAAQTASDYLAQLGPAPELEPSEGEMP